MAYYVSDKPADFDPFAKQGKKEKTYYVSDTPVDFDPFSQSRTKTQEMAPQSTTGQGTIQNQPIEQQTQPTQELKPTEPRNAVDVPPPAVAQALSTQSSASSSGDPVLSAVRNVLRPDYVQEPYLLATPYSQKPTSDVVSSANAITEKYKKQSNSAWKPGQYYEQIKRLYELDSKQFNTSMNATPAERDAAFDAQKKNKEEYDKLLATLPSSVQEQVARDKAENRYYELKKIWPGNLMDSAPPWVRDELRELDEQLHLTDSTFEKRVLSGRAKSWLDRVKFGQYAVHNAQQIATLFKEEPEMMQKAINRMRDMQIVAARDMPEGKSFVEKGFLGLLSNVAPMAESVVAGTVSAGVADKAYWAMQGKGSVIYDYVTENNLDLTKMSKEELAKLDAVSSVAGAAYAAVEYIGNMYGLQKAGMSPNVAKQFVQKAMKDGAFWEKVTRGGARFFVEWMKEGGEEFLQPLITTTGQQVLEGNVDVPTNIEESLNEWWDALPAAAFMVAGGGGIAKLGDRVEQNKAQQATELAAADRAAREAMRPQNAQMTQTDRGIVPNRPEIVAQAQEEQAPEFIPQPRTAQITDIEKQINRELAIEERIENKTRKASVEESMVFDREELNARRERLDPNKRSNLNDIAQYISENSDMSFDEAFKDAAAWRVRKRQKFLEALRNDSLENIEVELGLKERTPIVYEQAQATEDSSVTQEKQTQPISEQAPANTTTTPVKANEKKTVEPVRSSTITLQNKAGKTRTVDVVKETDTAFLYRDENGTQRRLMKTAWTKQTEQQVAKTNSKVEIDKEKNESTSNKSIKTNQTKDVPLSGSESPQSYRQRSEETIRKEIETNGLGGEFENFLARLESAKGTARNGSYGLQAQKDDQGYITGWYNQGKIYPEGFDAKSIPAIRNFIRGKRPLTQNQLDVVERAYELIQAEIGIKLEVVKNFKEDIKKGERPPQEVIDENPSEWEVAISESGINEDDLGDTSFDFGFNVVDKNEDAQVDSLKEWRKNHGIAEPDEQVEMFGKGAVGDVFELQSQVVKERESFSEKKAREEKQAKAEAAQTNMFEPSPEQAINRQETIEQSAPKGKESKLLSFLDKTQNKPRGVSSGNALGTGGGAGIDTFKPDVEQHGQKEVKLYERSKELIKKHGGNRKIMEGRNPSGTLGVSYNHSGNIALAALNNIGVAAHETTHNVDRKIRFTERITRTVGTTKDGKPKYDPTTIKERKELTEVYTEFYPNGNATHSLKKRVTEGFATFVQKYIEDPTTMSKRFPELKNMILDPSGKYYSPEVEALIKDARLIVNEYHRLDPLQKIGARITSKDSEKGKLFLNVKDHVETALVDRIWPVEKLAVRAGVQLTSGDPSLYVREYERVNRIFAHNTERNAFGKESYVSMRDGEYKEIHDFNWSTVIKELRETGMDNSFDQYLVARRKVSDYKKLDEMQKAVDDAKAALKEAVIAQKHRMEENDADQVSDKSVDNAKAKLAEARATMAAQKAILDNDNIPRDLAEQAVKLAKETVPGINEIESKFDKLVRADLDLLKEAGIISSEDHAKYSAEDGYATFKRDMYDDLIDPQTGKVVNVANLTGKSISSMKQRKGSERTIISPLYASIANHGEIMRKALRQIAWNKVADLSDKVPDLMQKEELKRIYDPDTEKTIYPQEQDSNIVMARRNGKREPYVINAQIKKYLDAALTPEAVTIAEHLVTGASRLFTKGTTSLYPAFAAMNIMVDQVTASAQTRTGYVPIVTQVKLLTKALAGESGKEANFLREYMILAGATQTSTGWNELSPDKAKKMIAREASALGKIVDAYQTGEKIFGIPGQASEIFTRASEYANSRMQGDNQFVALEKAGRVSAPFHHRGSFGGSAFARTLVRGVPYFNASMQVVKEYGKTFADPERRAKVATVTALVIGAKLAEIIPFALLASDDQKEKYKDLHADYLARYIFLPHPNGIDLLKFRVPEQMTGLAAPINMALQNYVIGNDYRAVDMKDASLAWVPDQFDITQPKRAFLSWIPQFGKPILEVLMNTKTWPDTLPVESQGVQYDLPKYREYRTTSEMAKALGEKTGLSPIKIDHLLQGYLGRSVKLLTKPGKEWSKNLNPFLQESYFSAGRSVQDFYDQADAVVQMRNAISDGKEKVTPKQASIIESDYQKVLSVKRGLKEYKDISDERTKEAEILRAKIIDTMDSLGTGDEYKEYFPKKKSFKPKLIEPYSTKEKTLFDTDRKSSREPTPFDNR